MIVQLTDIDAKIEKLELLYNMVHSKPYNDILIAVITQDDLDFFGACGCAPKSVDDIFTTLTDITFLEKDDRLVEVSSRLPKSNVVYTSDVDCNGDVFGRRCWENMQFHDRGTTLVLTEGDFYKSTGECDWGSFRYSRGDEFMTKAHNVLVKKGVRYMELKSRYGTGWTFEKFKADIMEKKYGTMDRKPIW